MMDKSRLPPSIKDSFRGDLFKDWVPEIRPEKWLMRLPSDVVKDTEPKGKTVLDAGTGRGRFAIAFAEAGAARVVAADISPYMLGLARESANRWGVSDKISFEIGDVESLKYPDNHFDIACCMAATPHLPYPERAISELARVCKIGGLVVVDAPITEPPQQGDYWKSFTEDEFKKLFEIDSLKIEVWRRYSLLDVETSTITCVARKKQETKTLAGLRGEEMKRTCQEYLAEKEKLVKECGGLHPYFLLDDYEKSHQNFFLRWLQANIRDKDATILDVGCGTGFLALRLHDLGYDNYCGIDIDLYHTIGIARELLAKFGLEPHLWVEQAEHTHFQDGQFDVVCVLDASYFKDFHMAATCKEAHRVLKHRGYLVMDVESKPSPMKVHPNFYNKEEMKKHLSDFSDIEFRELSTTRYFVLARKG